MTRDDQFEQRLGAVAEALMREFSGVLDQETVQAYLAGSLERLSDARIMGFVPTRAYRFIRERLQFVARCESGAGCSDAS